MKILINSSFHFTPLCCVGLRRSTIAAWDKRGVSSFHDLEGHGHRNRFGLALEEYFHRDPEINSG